MAEVTIESLKAELEEKEQVILDQAAEIASLKEQIASGGKKKVITIKSGKKTYQVNEPHFNAVIEGVMVRCSAENLQDTPKMIKYLLEESPSSLTEV